jgi:hypothetical protein
MVAYDMTVGGAPGSALDTIPFFFLSSRGWIRFVVVATSLLFVQSTSLRLGLWERQRERVGRSITWRVIIGNLPSAFRTRY